MKMGYSPTLCVEAALPSCIYQSCFENFLGSRFASWEHNASSAERILSAPLTNIHIISEFTKDFARIIYSSFASLKLVEI